MNLKFEINLVIFLHIFFWFSYRNGPVIFSYSWSVRTTSTLYGPLDFWCNWSIRISAIFDEFSTLQLDYSMGSPWMGPCCWNHDSGQVDSKPIQSRTTRSLRSEDTPPPPNDYPYHWVILDPKSKEDKVKVTNLKNLPKFQTDKVIPVYPPFNFVEAGGIINLIWIKLVQQFQRYALHIGPNIWSMCKPIWDKWVNDHAFAQLQV